MEWCFPWFNELFKVEKFFLYFKVAFYVREFEFICKYLNHDFFCPCEQKENFEQCAFHTCNTFFMINNLNYIGKSGLRDELGQKVRRLFEAQLLGKRIWNSYTMRPSCVPCHASNKHPTIPTPKHYFFQNLTLDKQDITNNYIRTIWAFRFSHLQWFHKWKSFTFLWGCLTLTKATQSEHALLPSGV